MTMTNSLTKYTIDQVSNGLFKFISNLTNDLIKNNKKDLKLMGIKKFNNETSLEIMIFYLFIVITGIKESKLSIENQKLIIDSILNHYRNCIELTYKNQNDIDNLMTVSLQRLDKYDNIYYIFCKSAFDNEFTGIESMMDVGKLFINAWENILKDKVNDKDIIYTTIFFDFFMNQTLEITSKTLNKINSIEIIE